MIDFKKNIIERIIGGFLIVFGCISFYAASVGFMYVYENLDLPWEEMSLLKVLHNFHFVSSIALIVSGILLIIHKQIGWIGSIIMSFFYVVLFLKGVFEFFFEDESYVRTDYSNIIIYSILGLLFLVIGFLLLQKHFIKKYQPTKTIWILIVLITVLLSVDEIFIR